MPDDHYPHRDCHEDPCRECREDWWHFIDSAELLGEVDGTRRS